ncbi:AI-2E family transporter [Candidatus Woesearchaeota archaeon]|nr:AI-2E family transporter [Candidatus Woesearchaeota archaeon]
MTKNLSRYAFYAMLAIVVILTFLIVKPFISTILASFVVAYLFYPLHKFLRKYIKKEFISALIVSAAIVVLFVIPIFFITNTIAEEATTNYIFIKQILATGNIGGEDCGNALLCNLSGFIEKYVTDTQVKNLLTNFTKRITDFFINIASDFIFSIPIFFLHFFIMIFIVFYLLQEGESLMYKVKHLLPLKKIHSKNIIGQLKDVTYAVIYGQLLISAGQGLLGGIAFAIFGVTSPILWGIAMFFFALVPFMGTPIIWVPAVIIKALTNHPGQAIGLLIAGLIISTADNFVRPKIVADKAKVHPVFILLGVIGGIILFGPIGIIIGPVVLSISMVFLKIYEEEIEAQG